MKALTWTSWVSQAQPIRTPLSGLRGAIDRQGVLVSSGFCDLSKRLWRCCHVISFYIRGFHASSKRGFRSYTVLRVLLSGVDSDSLIVPESANAPRNHSGYLCLYERRNTTEANVSSLYNAETQGMHCGWMCLEISGRPLYASGKTTLLAYLWNGACGIDSVNLASWNRERDALYNDDLGSIKAGSHLRTSRPPEWRKALSCIALSKIQFHHQVRIFEKMSLGDCPD